MPGRDPVEVTVEVEGRELVAGTLWIHERGGQAATFRYADSYLASPDSYELDPVLPKAAGAFHTQAGRAMFNAFADSAPDRWGENLMRRAERERARLAAAAPTTLGKADFLLGVRDDTRQGAVRFREPGANAYYSTHKNAVPRLIELPRLLRAVDRLDAEGTLDSDLKDLIDAGSSLGGARPKAAVIDSSGRPAIAKFPRTDNDEWNERHSPQASADLRELYRRVIFSVLTGNTDDHLRNHAFLRERRGWALSPAYDLNPNPDRPARLSTAIDLDDTRASIETALSVCGYLRLSEAEARTLISNIERVTSGWRFEAAALGLPASQVSRMADAFETDQRRIARALADK
jgi:hypothetical protein